MATDDVIREVVVGTPDGIMRGKVGVRAGPMRLSELVPTAYAMTNALVQRATQLVVLDGRTVSCGPGCGACCRQMVPVSIPEALRVVDALDAFPDAKRESFASRFAAAAATVARAGLTDQLLEPAVTSDPFLPVAREYFSLGIACPFLEDESCAIHENRPVACRDFNVTSPAEWCRSPWDHEIEKVPTPLPLSVPLARVAGAVLGQPPRLIPLSLVPWWISRHPELRARTWPGPDLFDTLLAELRALYPAPDEDGGAAARDDEPRGG